MPTIPYHATGFPHHLPANLHGHHDLDAPWPDILWAAITVGRKDWADVFQHGSYSVYECWYRAFIVLANLMEDQHGRVIRTNAFDGLDPSEKGAISYFIGLTVGKLFSARRLGVPWVMHLATYQNRFQPINFRGGMRPDLFGFNQHSDLLVMEAKGRSAGFSDELLKKAKKQTRSFRRMRGIVPSRRAATISHFANRYLELRIRDPRGTNRETFDLDLGIDEFIRDYYRKFVDLIETSGEARIKSLSNHRLKAVPLPGLDAQIGLDMAVLRAYRRKRGLYRAIVSSLPVIEQPMASEGAEVRPRKSFRRGATESLRKKSPLTFYGPDGIGIWLGTTWSSENMQRQPEERKQE